MLQGTSFSVTLDLHIDSVQRKILKKIPTNMIFYSQKQILEIVVRKESQKYHPQAC